MGRDKAARPCFVILNYNMNKKNRIQVVYNLLLKKFGKDYMVGINANSVYVKRKNAPDALAIIIHYKNSGVPDINSKDEDIIEFIKTNIDLQIP